MSVIYKENTPVSRCGRRCVAGGCSNTAINGVSMHTFPAKRPDIHRQWVAFVRRKRKDWEPTRHTVLCSAHFEEDCFPLKFRLGLLESSGKTVKRTLEEDAVPTIFNSATTPTMPTPTMQTFHGKRSSSPETELTTPKTVKRPRSAFVKRDMQLDQSNEVKSSCHMEKEGLIRAVQQVKDEDIQIKTIVTDRHVQIKKLLLAALHFNENVSREQASLPNGEKRYRITFPKQENGDYTVRQVRTECTFNYVEDLMKATKQRVKLLQIQNCEVVGESPPPLCMNFVHPEKSEAVSGLMSRFRQ
ncbi:THAP domain-containing protein 1-like [Mizuhopecten yessoensis]|uniref:THAP domain-containing protein 1-like n=1 Tax=Mizuhopecten yessoensis TaxID=6573 RepID=UPI000B45F8A1|nr:THAP domain-containing protein 1-like [Mizuhopecten yessoensis]